MATEIYGAGMAFAERIAHVDPVAKKSTLRQWLGTYVEFYDRYSGCIEAWAEGATDDPTIVSVGRNGQIQMDLGAARMLIRGQDRYPFDPVVSALILRALVTRVPQAALDLPEPIDHDELIDVLMACISRGFFGRAT